MVLLSPPRVPSLSLFAILPAGQVRFPPTVRLFQALQQPVEMVLLSPLLVPSLSLFAILPADLARFRLAVRFFQVLQQPVEKALLFSRRLVCFQFLIVS